MNVSEILNGINGLKDKILELKAEVDTRVFNEDKAHYIICKDVIDDSLEKLGEIVSICTPEMDETVTQLIISEVTKIKDAVVEVKNKISAPQAVVTAPVESTPEVPVQTVEAEFNEADVNTLLDNYEAVGYTPEEEAAVFQDLDNFINEDVDQYMETLDQQPMTLEETTGTTPVFEEQPIQTFNVDPILDTVNAFETPMPDYNAMGIDDGSINGLFQDDVNELRLVA